MFTSACDRRVPSAVTSSFSALSRICSVCFLMLFAFDRDVLLVRFSSRIVSSARRSILRRLSQTDCGRLASTTCTCSGSPNASG